MLVVNCWISLLAGSTLFLIKSKGEESIFTPSKSDYDEEWEAWKAEYVKSYASSEEEVYRRRIWTTKVESVKAHNKAFDEGLESFSQKVYGWADNKDSQIHSILMRSQLASFNWTVDMIWNKSRWNISSQNVPDALDYRSMGYVSSVDDQGFCNACWAFVVTGAVEGLMAMKTGSMLKLSSQQLLDCTGPESNCDNGMPVDAMAYAKEYGLMLDCDYGYEADKGSCRYDQGNVAFRFKNYIGFQLLSEEELKYNIATIGPGITFILSTDAYSDYSGGIYSTRQCYSSHLEFHFVLIVGYGTENGIDYWIIKDSAGVGWGENGYARFQRNVGLCEIGILSIWPGGG